MANATVFQTAQWGKESTSGTAVSASKKLTAISVKFEAQGGDAETFVPEGMKYPTGTIPAADELTALTLEGKLDFNNIVYPLSSLFGAVTPTQPDSTNAPTAYEWTWTPSTSSPETPVTYTLEKGSSVEAARVAYALMTGIGIKVSRKSADLSGEGIGYRQEDGITLTSSPSDVDAEWALPANVNIYLEDSATALSSATALTSLKEFSWKLSGKYGPDFYLNSAQTSFGDVVELAPEHTGEILVTKDTTATALRTKARAGDRKWLKFEVTGDTIGGSVTYEFTMILPIEFQNPGKDEDADGVYAMRFPFYVVHDSTWGKAISIDVINTVSAL